MSPESQPMILDGNDVERAENFVFLGSQLSSTSGDVKRRVSLEATAFENLRLSVLNKRYISIKLKIKLYKAPILPIAIYAAETLTLRNEDTRRLLTFEMRCLRAILGVSRRDRIRNECVRHKLKNGPNYSRSQRKTIEIV